MVEDGNDEYDDVEDDEDDDKENLMDVLPPLVARRVERLKHLITERERVMEQHLEERAAPEMKYWDPCKPLYKYKGNVVTGCLDDEIEMIHKERGDEKEEEGPKGDGDGDNRLNTS